MVFILFYISNSAVEFHKVLDMASVTVHSTCFKEQSITEAIIKCNYVRLWSLNEYFSIDVLCCCFVDHWLSLELLLAVFREWVGHMVLGSSFLGAKLRCRINSLNAFPCKQLF